MGKERNQTQKFLYSFEDWINIQQISFLAKISW